jgi:murein DD-endopeptidase MepM/ murein hydrolase activator NlpD
LILGRLILQRYFRPLISALCIILAVCLSVYDYIYHTPSQESGLSVTPLLSSQPNEATVCDDSEAEGGKEAPKETTVEETIRLKRGETLLSALTNIGIERTQAQEVADSLKGVFNPKELKPTHEIYISYIQKTEPSASKDLQELYINLAIGMEVFVNKDEKGSYVAKKNKKKLVYNVQKTKGQIESSLYIDASKQNVPAKILNQVNRLLMHEIDFQRSIQNGNKFGFLFDKQSDPDTLEEEAGDLIFATLVLQDRTISIYQFKHPNGSVEYFNAQGESIKKGLLRTPIDGARISSGFGKRNHPVLGYTKQHKGVDFSAPTGTPIMAAGDGVVEKIGRWKGYGNYIRIKHNNEFSTAYAHLSRYAKGLRQGKRIKQGELIGYVGSTGLATGPHLHYELIRFNNQINPDKVKMLPARKLSGKDLERFKQLKLKIDKQYNAPDNIQVSQALPQKEAK